MTAKTATEELEVLDLGSDAGGPGPGDFDPGGNGGGGAALPAVPQQIYLTGIWLALLAILMFFSALTSSFIVRKGLSNDWLAFDWPRILWLNTAVLLASSATLERARRSFSRGRPRSFRTWWWVTTALGVVFLAGQVVAWREVAALGVYLHTNPSSSFFYLLTGAHGLHLLGGLLALFYVGGRSAPEAPRLRKRTAVHVTTVYWHFMGGLWVFLFLLLQWGQ